MRTRLHALPAIVVLASACCGCSPKRDAGGLDAPRTVLSVFLVRHAEKLVGGEDPPLSVAGHERAATLADLLRDAGIDHVHSSDYQRTRDTATPIADALGLELELYDPRDLASLVRRLQGAAGRHLVVGHSDTTPRAVELLGGEPGSPLDERVEYDRLYLVTIGTDGRSNTLLLRYGRRSVPSP